MLGEMHAKPKGRVVLEFRLWRISTAFWPALLPQTNYNNASPFPFLQKNRRTDGRWRVGEDERASERESRGVVWFECRSAADPRFGERAAGVR